jgi:hypothetical protein
MSIGDGMNSITASSMRCTPLFLKAVPQSIGWISVAIVRVRRPRMISSSVSSPDSRYLFISSSLASAAASTMFSRHFCAFGLQLGRDVLVLELHALRGLVPDDGLHLDEVDHALEVLLGADRHHDGHRDWPSGGPSSGRRP